MFEDQERVLGNGMGLGQSETKSIRLREKKYKNKRGGIREAKARDEEDGCC
jgi:hypothetical protein